MNYCSEKASNGEDIANLFVQYFKSTYSNDNFNNPYTTVPTPSQHAQISAANISTVEILPKNISTAEKTRSFKIGWSRFYFTNILKEGADNLSQPLSYLFNFSICKGLVPNMWKAAFITPVHKKGNKCDIENYRPISKRLIAKIFEKIVYQQVYTTVKPQLTSEQHGFLRNLSKASNLIIANEYISSGMDRRAQVDVV
ncbi:unnamed protein product [Pieris macdunnoughi]|nr:unnamed protein product [Pieris macdunnoughi]